MKFSPDTTTIIITDPQIDYVSTKGRCSVEFGWDVSKLQEMAQKIGDFIEKIKNDFDVVLLQNEEAIATYPDNMPMIPESDELCVTGTEGYNFHPAINAEGCKIIQKNRPSGFARELGGHLSELELYLLGLGKTDLVHAGVLAGRCANATIMGAHDAGFRNHVLTDLTGNPLGKSIHSKEEEVIRALWKSHYAMNIFDSSQLEAA